ncbi:peptidoglycan DD-metalloendopeptidase family protein [Dictyobacter kobayashii]|uniref:Uncharacterized protein n=1 Tax=Dictyobacter kobayashii TaxID=2014872 RepID=A0A402AFH5_9CHLR|nr:peptidoglycan DD-metalloendopeptidase family protein [Dictyobacter kobayashii]GCE17835.1 hypothetical protein KDK_16350 [Dictyobacter kobayashii]
MKFLHFRQHLYPLLLVMLLMSLPVFALWSDGGAWLSGLSGSSALADSMQYQQVLPFMHRPYYGYRTIMQRTISFVDHDKPWYANDGVFVRFDGVSWRTSVYDCVARLSCYDGHNGYDMDLKFEPVLSVASGRVIRAGWYNAVNHNSSFGLWVAIDHGNGIVTSYGHLSSILVGDGDQIGAQWQIGTSGTTGASTGPHLHMSAYYLPDWRATDPFGWRGRMRDPNIVRDNYLWVDAPATRTAVPYLGGPRVYPGAILVDDSSRGWSSTGYWRKSVFGTDIGGSLHWTTTGEAYAMATWRPMIPADGYYEVGVYVDDTHATSSWVPYTVHSASPGNPAVQATHTIRVDESHIGIFNGPFGIVNTGTQWVSLGTYYFRRGTTGNVVLSNVTGELGTQVAADGVEFVPAAGGYNTPSSGAYIGGDLNVQP